MMPCIHMKIGRCGARVHVSGQYEPGDPAPSEYLDWHEWAEVQYKAGLRQKACCRCSKWKYPQELSGIVDVHTAYTSRMESVRMEGFVCLECALLKASVEP